MTHKSARMLSYTLAGLILPVVLIYFNIIPFEYRHLLLALVVLIILIGMYIEGMSAQELGFRTDSLKSSFPIYFWATSLALILTTLHAYLTSKTPLDAWWEIPYFRYGFIPLSIAQEVIYRGFFQTQYQKITKPWMAILLTTIFYSSMHILWHSLEFIVMTFIAGLMWGWLWYKRPNLIWLSLSHAALNFLINYFGYINVNGP